MSFTTRYNALISSEFLITFDALTVSCNVFSRILLDTGDKDVPEYQKHLAQVVQSEQVNIEHIVLTHWHHDHVGGVENIYGSIASKYQVTNIKFNRIKHHSNCHLQINYHRTMF